MTPPPEPAGERVAVDRLTVGPARVETDRVVMPYRVQQADGERRFDLAFRWQEPVLDPEASWSHNLAGLIGVQPALNYGLFCRHIALRGAFDTDDRTLLTEMLQISAREIWVNRLLRPNPFLRPPPALPESTGWDPEWVAGLEFAPPAAAAGAEFPPWHTEPARAAVLSSGGKDSLLSYGLLRELGIEVHPIFVNESGRHWLTALNAYRYLCHGCPRTARVWTNADRLFAWMLRRLPFIRPDFARLRSDDYPLRLWTVAVFSFAALPLLRARGIGRLVIGDEHDTTVRRSTRGITHYAGLYDQSRWFDNAMTRYFQRKRFAVLQFSLLRPASELLVEKTIWERYPELWAQQVSCHAAHPQKRRQSTPAAEDARVLPCGRCEKCRRIVGMLLALGAEPGGLGYDPAQVAWCLDGLVRDGVAQETAAVQQLGFALRQRGLITADRLGRHRIRERPEVLSLRFDTERSPPDTLPADLRPALLRILLQHAAGAVRRVGRVWNGFDPLAASELYEPYRFSHHTAAGDGQPAAPAARREHLWAELSWPQAERRLAEVDLALLPVGALEQHGPHLPLDTDAYDADRLARLVAAACRPPRPLVLPLIPYGVSYHHEDFRGTVGIRPGSLSQLVYDVGMAAARNGITKLVIVNGHGGNAPALKFAAQMINAEAHIFTCVDTGETSDADLVALTETPDDVHAGEIETSTSLATRPELVAMDRAARYVPRFSSRYLDFSSKRSVEWYARTARISPCGVLGDPTRATAEKGRRMWRIMVSNLVEFVEQLKALSLDEIYQRRY